MQEVYKVSLPNRIVFGDPMYFDEFAGEKLESLTVDFSPPSHFSARVILEEVPCKEYPDLVTGAMMILLAPDNTIDVYQKGKQFESQQGWEKEIGVDTARYLLQVDDRYDIIHTGGDGYWGSYVELFREPQGIKQLDAVMINILQPDDEDTDDMRRRAAYFFPDMQMIESHNEIPSVEMEMQ